MGKIFLIAIVVGLAYGAYGIYGHISGLTNPEPVKLEAVEPVARPSVEPEGEDSGQARKAAPVASSSEKIEPLPVLSSNHEWIQIEAWGIIGPGEELPDGAKLESWDKSAATVVTPAGNRERRRFRTFAEAMSKILPAVASATGEGINERLK
jgi:hypothetical protein